ncbi:MAG: YifB family Mg chelatase-like AAA ATPase [Planctomycetota bacterium]
MLARVHSALLQGIDALPCEVEVDYDPVGLDHASVVGLPDAAVRESLDRVRAAVVNTGYAVPTGKLLFNLAPADVRKEGPVYDLPIAVGLLIAGGSLPERAGGLDPRSAVFAGELALDGRVRPIKGAIGMATMARAEGKAAFICPAENASEAAVVAGIEVFGVSTLAEVAGLIAGELEREPERTPDVESLIDSAVPPIDFAEIRGQEAVKRAVTIAAAGAHNLLMLGPAGSGKTMMAKALPGVLPPLTADEAIEVTRVYSAAGALPHGQSLVTQRPVRTPHHTASSPAIVGGGAVPRPGEISLAHRGVLFLDELPEFGRGVLETLRQPLEDHVVTIARSHGSVKFPASFMMVSAMNPTPRGDVAPGEVGQREMERYIGRISGPLLDRMDIHVEAPAVPFEQLSGTERGTDTATMRTAVLGARGRSSARQGAATPNARLSGKQLDDLVRMDDAARALLGQAITSLGLSARAYDKIRRVSLTIADLEGDERVRTEFVAEAVQYRLLDRRV